jgi:hypothetical protein
VPRLRSWGRAAFWNEASTHEHRDVTEDVVLGLPYLESAVRSLSAPSPTISGLLGRPLAGGGRDLDHLGLGELTLRDALLEGWRSATWRRVVRA